MAEPGCPSRSSSFILQITLALVAQCATSPVWMPQFLSGGYGRNIRHLPCVSRRTGESGVCMFAYACLKANGTHLGTCIDRFYFGSCCKINDIDDLGSSPSLLGEGDNNEQENNIGPIFPPPFHRPPPPFHQQESIISTSSASSNTFTYPSSSTIKIAEEPDTSIVSETTSSTTTTTTTTTTQFPYLLSTFQSVQDSDNIVHIDHSKPKPSKTSPKPFSDQTYKPDIVEASTSKFSTVENFSRETDSTPITSSSTLSSPSSLSSTTITTAEDKFTEIPLITKPPLGSVTGPESKYPYSTLTSRPSSTSTHPSITKKPIETKPTEKPAKQTTTTRKPSTKPSSTTRPLTKPPPIKLTTTFSSSVSPSTKPSSSSTLKPVTKKPSLKPTQKPSTISSSIPIITSSSKPTPITQKPTSSKTTTKPKLTTTTTKPKPTILTTKPKPATSTTKPKPATTVKPATSKPATSKPSTGSKPTTSKSTTTSKLSKPKPSPKPTTSKPTTFKPIPSINVTTTTSKPTKPSSTTSKPTTKPITTTSTTTTNSTFSAAEVITTTYKPSEVTKPTTVKPILTAKPTSKPATTQKPIAIKPTFRPPKPTTTTNKPTTKPVLIPVPITTVIPPLTSVSSTASDVTTTTTIPSLITWISLGETSSTTPSTDSVSSSSDDDWILVPITTTTHESTTTTLGPDTTTDQLTQVTSIDTSSSGSTTAPEGALVSTTTPLNASEYRDVCGRRFFPESRIVGGEKSSFGKWPWQISLRQWRTSTYLHKCGAALLNENWAITAAHCVESVPPSDLLLRLGEHDLSSEDEPYGYQERRVQIVASHPQFDPRTFEYDLALLRFYEPVIFQPNIIPVCVPEDDINFVGRTAYVTGWGRLYEDGPLPSVLQEVSVPVINNTLCETMYRSAGYIEHIPHIFICAGWRKGGFDSCEGDSGGPMVIQRPDRRWLLAGIISWGIGCAEPNQPGVYTRISEFREWINQILQF